MKKIALALLAVFVFSTTSFAHPLGFKEFGNRLKAEFNGDAVTIDYVIEIPTTILVGLIKNYMAANRLQSLSAEDEVRFNEEVLQLVSRGLEVYIDGVKLAGDENPKFAGDKSGFGDFNFFEYRVHLIFPFDALELGRHSLKITNANFKAWPSVYLNEVNSSSSVKIVSSTADSCKTWGRDSFCRDTMIEFELLSRDVAAASDDVKPQQKPEETNHLIKLLRQERLDGGFILMSLVAAFFLGAAHAFSPGHGKALVASYLVGTRGTISHSLFLGLVVTLSHISGVVIFGVLALVVSQYVLPEQYAPYIDIASGLMILGIGVQIGRKRFLVMKSCAHREHDDNHIHDHLQNGEASSWRQLLSMGFAAGIVPCPTAFVVMITAIAINRISYGLLLIAAFSLGLAVVLSAIGVAIVKMSGRLEKFDRFKRAMPVVSFLSAVIVLLLGCVIVWRGLAMLAG